ncbi:MAG: pyridoxal-phosphate dependent enzyme [Ruminococcaceae bacterium]|nr:pyridoxal-phosphate dependent enzyme [Oscillospiraceae bacterium]
MQEPVGHAPMVKLNHIRMPGGVSLFAKPELWNPAGSVKDRIGQAMLGDAERTGRQRPGGTTIEATAGNTGLGIAFAWKKLRLFLLRCVAPLATFSVALTSLGIL